MQVTENLDSIEPAMVDLICVVAILTAEYFQMSSNVVGERKSSDRIRNNMNSTTGIQ